MAIFINQNRKVKNIFINVNGEKKSISSAWVNKDGVPTKIFQRNHDPHASNRIKIGTTETRVIAGQELEFICIDDAYVDATGYEKGALFIAKDFISGTKLTMGVNSNEQNKFVKDWALNDVRGMLNGETSNLADLLYVDTTIRSAYSNAKTDKSYNVGNITSYGTASVYNAAKTIDQVFILSLEEAIKYNKVIINGKSISVMWDMNCDGIIEFKSSSTGRYGYYLRTPVSGATKSAYVIQWNGNVNLIYNDGFGIRPCYVKYIDSSHIHNYIETIVKKPTCTEAGEKICICECGNSYTEIIPTDGSHIDKNNDNMCDICGHMHIWEDNTDTISWVKNFNSSSIVKVGDQWKLYYDTSNQYTKYTLDGYWDITVPEDIEYSFDYRLSDWGSDSLAIYLDDTEIVNVSETSSESKTVTLTKGTHTIHAHFNKKSEWTSPYAMITLNPIEMFNHICTECGEKADHHYTKSIIIKEPTCTEKGEKEFTCTKCNGTKIEEIDALGHNYVDGVCDRCGSLNLIKKPFWSASASTSTTEDTGGGHNDVTTLPGTSSPNIEITEDMRDGEYLLLDFYVGYPFYGGQGHYGEVDGINGLSMLQRYDEETGTWETVYSYNLSYQTIGTYMKNQEGSYGSSSGDGIMKVFQLEKGRYRVYGRFSAGRGCGSSVAHYYYSYRIRVDLCQVAKNVCI